MIIIENDEFLAVIPVSKFSSDPSIENFLLPAKGPCAT